MTNQFNVDAAIKTCLSNALNQARGDMKQVAHLTGLSRATCYRLLTKYGLNLKEMRARARSAKLG